MIAILMSLALAAGAGSASSTPESVNAPPDDAPVSSKEDLTKIKCVRQAPTGTRFEKRICKTVHEWNRQGKEARSDLKQIQDRPMTDISRGN